MVLGGSLHILIRDWIRYDLQMYRDDSFFFFFFFGCTADCLWRDVISSYPFLYSVFRTTSRLGPSLMVRWTDDGGEHLARDGRSCASLCLLCYYRFVDGPLSLRWDWPDFIHSIEKEWCRTIPHLLTPPRRAIHWTLGWGEYLHAVCVK